MTEAVDHDATVTMFTEISGLSREAAKNTLSLYNYNIEEAINFMLEGPSEEPASTSTNIRSTDSNETSKIDQIETISDEEFVREPIPPKREMMILPEEDNFRYRKKRAMPSRSICPLRNFELEGRLQEEHLEAFTAPQKLHHVPQTAKRHSSHTASSSAIVDFGIPRPKRSRLEYLYRPPVEICFSGSFQAAKDYAQAQNRWLVVNLQDNTDFKCQILNRDIWSNKKIRDILQRYYIFWQVATDNAEGMRFQVFYGVTNYPYICILDPRTGEEKYSYKEFFEFKDDHITQELKNFLTQNTKHPNPELAVGSSSDIFDVDLCIVENPSPGNEHTKLSQTQEEMRLATLSEEEQINIAIKNSLREVEAGTSKDDRENDCEELDPFSSTDEDSNDVFFKESDKKDKKESSLPKEPPTYEDYIGCSSDPITRLQLRLPDGERHILEWPCSTKIQALKLYIPKQFPDITKDVYKVICPFATKMEHEKTNFSTGSHKNILEIDESLTLRDANLHPNAILHIQRDD